MPNHKHLTLDHRSHIQTSLNEGRSFRQIAKFLNMDPSSISKEIRKHRIRSVTGAIGRVPNKCIHRLDCTINGLCSKSRCTRLACRSCKKCNDLCSKFMEDQCHLLKGPPYVCNGCSRKNLCVLNKYFYKASFADTRYLEKRSICREGSSFSEGDLQWMDSVITPLVAKGQSLHHICASQSDKLLCSERTVYKFIDQGVLTVRNIDLPRKVRYRPRRRVRPFKVDKACRLDRTYPDYLSFNQENPETPVVQMDSVEGCKGGKVFLTIFFTQSDLMLIYLRERNTSQSVIDVFNLLDESLGRETFCRLFPVILTDNGSEFSNPRAIEFDALGRQRTRVFYCDPSAPFQKAQIERAHELIRMVLPKGKSFDRLCQKDVTNLSCHINSLIRKKLNDQSPQTTFSFFHGDETLRKLGLSAIPPAAVTLSPELLAAAKEVDRHEENL